MLTLLIFATQAFLYGSILDVDRAWNNQFQVTSVPYDIQTGSKRTEVDNLRAVLKDPDGLISNTFKIPNGLKDRVNFWAQIYTIYPSSAVVIHDRDDLSIVYKVVDSSNIFSDPSINEFVKEARFKKQTTTEKNDIIKILRKISRVGGIKYFSPKTAEEKRIAKIIKHKMTNQESKYAYEDIRIQQGLKDSIIKGLKVSSRYIPIIEEIFRENNLPWELTRLPFVESSFDLKAGSKVGAKGIWQIIDKTGKKYLETDPTYDERYSPFKASAVAAKILKSNYDMLGTWPLAITAYNHGPGGLKKAIIKLKTKDIVKIISDYEGKRFGFASQNFYSEFLAALYITVYSERLFGAIEKKHPMNFSYVNIQSDMNIDTLSKISGLKISEIHNYNPEFSKKMLEGQLFIKRGSKIKLPPRASYKVEDYFLRIEDKSKIEKKSTITGGVNVTINS